MTDKRIEEIVLQYDYNTQSRQCIEEMAELTQAINKFWRKDLKCGKHEINFKCACYKCSGENYDNLCEEIADVQIMLEQMKEMLNCGYAVGKIIDEKLKREINRIKEIQAEKEEMSSAEAIERLGKYKSRAKTNEISQYDIKLHNACIKALQEKIEREEKESGV